MDINYPVRCPLLNEEIVDEVVCFDIHSVVDAGAPKYTAPKEAVSKENFESICRNCKYHRND